MKSDFQMRACNIDVKNRSVGEHSMTWENVDDKFLSEKSCFQNSMIPNMKKERYVLLFTCVYFGRQIRFCTGLPMAGAPTRYPLFLLPAPSIPTPQAIWGRWILSHWIEVVYI